MHGLPLSHNENQEDCATNSPNKENANELDDEMSEIEPLKAGELIEPIVFEGKRKIRLSRSTYKVNSYIDFRPYQDSFKKFEVYIHRFSRDLWDPDYVGALVNMHRIKKTMNISRKEVRHTLVQQHVGMQPMIVESRDSICNYCMRLTN